jgi:Na+-transporting NADH:ubiquinone oxidoreductase subunit NqrD
VRSIALAIAILTSLTVSCFLPLMIHDGAVTLLPQMTILASLVALFFAVLSAFLPLPNQDD